MRVISGSLKGRNIKGYQVIGTRPTMDRVKESLFAIIQDFLEDSVVLDLFAGSGNLGIEAISNGSSKCYLNDINKECTKVIKDNVNTMGIYDKTVILNMDYLSCLEFLSRKNEKFDLIFLDPPYKMECLNEVIGLLQTYDLVKDKGLIICEVSHKYLNDFEHLEKIKEKKYGDKTLIIFKQKK